MSRLLLSVGSPHMISVSAMREIERKANAMGISDATMMEHAGSNAARIADMLMELGGKRVMVFCGTGNNAGDGLVFARHALGYGAHVKILFVRGAEGLKPLPMQNYIRLKELRAGGGAVSFLTGLDAHAKADVLVDAMLGIGIRGNVDGACRKAIEAFNEMAGVKVSLDCPSGLDCDTGMVLGAAVRPDVTITFYDFKMGMNEANSGWIIVAGIGAIKQERGPRGAAPSRI